MEKIVLLSSADSGMRMAESQMRGTQFRYLQSSLAESAKFLPTEKLDAVKILKLEDVSLVEVLKRGTVSEKLFNAASEVGLIFNPLGDVNLKSLERNERTCARALLRGGK